MKCKYCGRDTVGQSFCCPGHRDLYYDYIKCEWLYGYPKFKIKEDTGERSPTSLEN